jgi:hypothetical protein
MVSRTRYRRQLTWAVYSSYLHHPIRRLAADHCLGIVPLMCTLMYGFDPLYVEYRDFSVKLTVLTFQTLAIAKIRHLWAFWATTVNPNNTNDHPSSPRRRICHSRVVAHWPYAILPDNSRMFTSQRKTGNGCLMRR